MHVVNRHGERKPLDLEKIHTVLGYAVEGVTGVSVSEIELKAQIQFYDGIQTEDIHKTIIKSAAELISEDTPNYTTVAARLLNFDLRKRVYGQFEPTSLYNLVKRNVRLGVYDADLIKKYKKADWEEMEKAIKYERDDKFQYAGMMQMLDKYIVQDRTKDGVYYETPQVLYMVLSAADFMNEPKAERMALIKEFYEYLSTFKLGLATPVLAGLRTPTKQFSSCVVIDTGDDLDSIGATAHANIRYVSKKAGLGNNIGRIRPVGSSIRNGEIKHTGLIPFLKLMKASVKSCSQGGVRGGAVTTHFPIWHHDVEQLLVLKNNKGTEETRERHMDYSVQFNGYMYKRILSGQDVCLLDPSLPGLYEAFFNDQEEFARLYEQYEKDPLVMKKFISGKKLMDTYIYERVSTGRMYLMNVDNVNSHTAFLETIWQSNLCQEIALPTTWFDDVKDLRGRIALCTLANINWGVFKTPEEMRDVLRIIVRFLDNILSYQDYPMEQARLATEEYRPLGVGVNNLAFFIAKNGCKYQDGSALELVDEWMEHYAYYLQEATIDLAAERGACTKSHMTKRADGIMLCDTYNKNVNKLVEPKLRLDWNALREGARKYGVRNAVLSAQMPSESNSLVINSLNGMEPARELVTTKMSGKRVMKVLVPQIKTLKNKYDLLWDQKSPVGYLNIMAVIQKWTDQAISVNTSYNPQLFENGKLPLDTLYKDILHHYVMGGKTLYYNNTLDDIKEESETAKEQEQELETSEVVEEDCESCKL